MKKKQSITMMEYSNQLNRKFLKVTRHAKRKKIWRWIAFFLTAAVCAVAIMFGINSKTAQLEEQYQEYCIEQDRTILDSKLLGYKDTLRIFEQTSMGNKIAQTQMGGFFYFDKNLLIYPDVEVGCTKIENKGKLSVLCNGFASDINVFDGNVYFRDTVTMKLMKYDLKTQDFSRVDLDGVGQFAICDGEIFFRDLNSRELKLFKEGAAPEVLSSGAVTSFAIAGNQILYLDVNYVLHSVSISTKVDEVVGHNINSFFYNNGELWIQNNTDIYAQTLDGNTLEPLECTAECHRILGMTDDYLIFDGDESIHVYNLKTQSDKQLKVGLVFVGMSDDGKLLIYNLNVGAYQILSTEESIEVPREPKEECAGVSAENFTEESTEVSTEELEEESTEAPIQVPVEESNKLPIKVPKEDSNKVPTKVPAEEPTKAPIEELIEEATETPTEAPTEEPTETPTEASTEEPTETPTEVQADEPSEAPTEVQADEPSEAPTEVLVEEATKDLVETHIEEYIDTSEFIS